MTTSLLDNSRKPSTENTRNSHSAQDSQVKAPWNTTSWRWLALFLMNLLLLGDYVVIDTPQALETQLEEALGLSTQQYSYLYSSWALPSIVVPIVGGYLTDFLGVRTTLVISCVGLTIGQLFYYYGTVVLSFSWMLFGRAIYALGSNPLNVAQIVIIYKWFQGRELALAMAISSTTSCIGRALNSFAVPKIYEMTQNLDAPTFFGVVICFISAVACFVVVMWDRENDKREQAFIEHSSEEVPVENTDKVSLSDIKYFGPAVWLLVINFGLTDGYFFSFNVFSNSFYHNKYEFSNSAAGNIISLNYIFGACSSILVGFLIDKKGYRASIILYNSFLGIIAFMFYIMVPECPQCYSTVLPQIFFGLLIGINDAAVFPSLPLVLDEKYIGTGYGLFFVIQNFFMLILPPISAYIKDITSHMSDEFFWMLVFFLALSILTTFESFALLVQDKKLGRILDLSVVKEEDEAEEELLDEESRRSSVSSQLSILKKSKAKRGKKSNSMDGPLAMEVEMVKLESLYRPPVYAD